MDNYKVRHLQKRLLQVGSQFKIVLLTGMRQVGKTTLLTNLFPDIPVITFEMSRDVYQARTEPELFFQRFKPPLILDEIQYAPELLPVLKRIVDQSSNTGQYYLTGSHNILMLKSVTESLMGRVGMFHLEPMTAYEHAGLAEQSPNWLDLYLGGHDQQLHDRFVGVLSNVVLEQAMWQGGMPGLIDKDNAFVSLYLRGYVTTYLERDVRSYTTIPNLAQFDRFLRLCAALSGQLINMSHLGRDVDIAPRQARDWLSVIKHSCLWRELQPFYGRNMIKRLSKTAKGYFADTGLACSLLAISSPQALNAHPFWGALFETWVINGIAQLLTANLAGANLYHWRVNNGAEVDLIIERDGYLHPIEIKSTSQPGPHDARGIRSFREHHKNERIRTGLIIHAGTECYRVNDEVIALPWHALVV